MKRILLQFSLLLILLPLLTGCWNSRQLTDLALVMAMGFDRTEEGRYKISFQIAVPSSSSSKFSGNSDKSPPVVVFTSTGDTVFEALRRAAKSVPRRMFFSHTSNIIVSEEIARQGLSDMLDLIDRDPEFRTQIHILIARESSAEELLRQLTPLEEIPARKISGSLENTESLIGTGLAMTVDEMIETLIIKNKQPIITGIKSDKQPIVTQERAGEPNLIIDGLAIFKEDRLQEWVDDKDARGILLALGKIKSTIVNLSCKGEEDKIAIEVIRSNTSLTVNMEQEIPKLKVNLGLEGNIAEVNCPLAIESSKVVHQLEKKTEKELTNEVMKSIHSAQELKLDIFGFGEGLHRKNPEVWKKVKHDWNNLFSEAEVDVSTDFQIRRAGLRTKTIYPSGSN
ncbi:Ger(x)C family spore germination protein [Bacillus sp. Marseille-Q3570]|uniref:Ger(x)C family spore germination protein n=1 Tax=Bacillus sp. Marseille-Q3570 TaxID=2963522 RepID=UPI0021B80EB0|nr:Ger(x)C family spore germination protein [Bacillus sp. Marseille-Q3570]